MNRLSRSTALKIAAILSFLVGVYAFVGSLPDLAQGEAALVDGPPFSIIIMGFVFAILRIVGAYGVWVNQRWGIVLTILANLIDAVLAAPGLLFAPTMEWRIAAAIGVAGGIIIIVLCLWRDRASTTA